LRHWAQQYTLNYHSKNKIMEDSIFHIIIVDDTMGENDPFVVNLKLDYGSEAKITYFENVSPAMDFIDMHMSERMIVFMDCKFGSVWEGIDAVIKLRKKTALVYVVMMSANPINQLKTDDLASLINTENIFFIKNTDEDGAKEKIERIRSIWKSRFDCILERWLTRHPEISDVEAFSQSGKKYTWKDILSEIRMQTPVGKAMEQMVNQFYLYKYAENKE